MGEPGACSKWFKILLGIMVFGHALAIGLDFVFPRLSDVVGSLFDIAYYAILTFLLCTVRQRVRAGDNIPPGPCDCCECDDCCTSFWCDCCSLVQILRHLGIYGGNYSLTASNGSFVVDAEYGPEGPYGRGAPWAPMPPMTAPPVATATAPPMATATAVPMAPAPVAVATATPVDEAPEV